MSQDKREAVEILDRAITLIYNIEGDRWQMAYEVLEALIANLRIEVSDRGADHAGV
jgi:hypothetical protein